MGADLGRAVAGMDIFFNPSITETFGNVTLEAMACGVPVVAARATGATTLVRDGVTGQLVTPGDIAAYADAIAAYIADPALRRAARRGGRGAQQGVQLGGDQPLDGGNLSAAGRAARRGLSRRLLRVSAARPCGACWRHRSAGTPQRTRSTMLTITLVFDLTHAGAEANSW